MYIALGSIVEAGGVEWAKTAKGFVSLISGTTREELDPRWTVRLLRRPFGLPINKEKN
jgi:hypothetical protein